MRQSSWLWTLVLVCDALSARSPATVNNDDSCDVIVAPAATLLPRSCSTRTVIGPAPNVNPERSQTMTLVREAPAVFIQRVCCALWILAIAGSALGATSPATVNNDDSCDVIVAPAATLLLPYFEVDLTRPDGETTLFTVTNVTHLPQIAHVTVWTDWSHPVLAFNIFLTGYDVQAVNLYDVLVLGFLSGENGTSSDFDVGERSAGNDENPLLDISSCDILAVVIPPFFLRQIQDALTRGVAPPGQCPSGSVGEVHERAIGYLTIDVMANCNGLLPTDAGYFTSEILYDNVLTGDYQQVSPQKSASQGGPMVHIRAIPEGGGTGAAPTNFTTTFYSNQQSGGTADRRQPLPATFAARWISAADGSLKSTFKIWREGVTPGDPKCAVAPNGSLSIADVVRFDEDENPVAFSDHPSLPATSNRSSDDSVFPPNPDGAMAGWMYMNLNDQRMLPFRPLGVASQNWVAVSMEAAGSYSVEFDAASLGNGCTPALPSTGDGETVIAPAVNTIQPAFASSAPATVNNDDSCDIRVAPAATLLLPLFRVDLDQPADDTTFMTITNVGPLPQIARVTVWTDWAYPVLTFNIFLTGYDVQAIDLYDVLARGLISLSGTTSDSAAGPRSAGNDMNPLHDLTGCDIVHDPLPPNVLADVRSALTLGRTTACANARVGSTHTEAIGYATIDVVQNCGSAMPVDAGYFTTQVLYDNVLIGDYQQVDRANRSARGNTMVHIRAIPEGGLSGWATTNFRRTFYSRLQNGGTADRRQPLPSTFAARWIAGGDGSFGTAFTIWREGRTTAAAGCSVLPNSEISYPDVVRFDEDENPTALLSGCLPCITPKWDSPALWRVPVDGTTALEELPPNPGDDVAGWMYLNLDNYDTYSQGPEPGQIALQNWVVVSMESEGRYAVDFDAASLGNGCSPSAPVTGEQGDAPFIGPAPNVNPSVTPNP